jgi:hypothetical protein
VIYQNSQSELAFQWSDSCELISELYLEDILDNDWIQRVILKELTPPKWWLLKIREN